MGGASTATMAASLAIMYSRGVRELCSTEAMVMSASVSRTGPSVLMNSSSCECGRAGLSEGGDEDGLDGVQAVLGLVEDDAGGRAEHLVGHLKTRGHAGMLHDLAPDDGVGVVERRQAVHELDGVVPGLAQQVGIDLVGGEHPDPFGPYVLGLSHRHPHVGVDEVGV